MTQERDLETAMRLVLRAFAAGNLVWRSRETTVEGDVVATARRVRSVRGSVREGVRCR